MTRYITDIERLKKLEPVSNINEHWAEFPQNSVYYISTHGRVYSCLRNRILKQQTDKRGYKRVSLVVNGKQKGFLVHRLLGFTFLNKLPKHTQVNHIDGVKDNNKLENLEWCTNQENMNHAVETGLSKQFANRSKQVKQFNLKGKLIAIYETGIEASNQTGIARTTIYQAARGENKNNKAKGFIWKYAT